MFSVFGHHAADLVRAHLHREIQALRIVLFERTIHEVGIGKAAVLHRVQFVLIDLRAGFPRIVVVDSHAVGLGRDRRVIGRFGSALDLERIDRTAVENFGDMRREVEVFGVHDVRSDPRIFFEPKQCSRFRVGGIELVRKPAIVGAAAAVGHPTALQRRNQAAAAVRETHGAVHEHLQFQIGKRLFDLHKVAQRDFARGDNARRSHVVIDLGIEHVHDVGLRREVLGNMRRDLVRKFQHAGRGDDHRVGFEFGHRFDMFFKQRQLRIERKAVDRRVDLFAARMGIVDAGFEIFHRKFFARTDSQRKVADPAVHGVGTEIEGDFEFFEIACGRKQFGVVLACLIHGRILSKRYKKRMCG